MNMPTERLQIHGGHALRGEIEISGAKNAALPLVASVLLAPGIHRIRRVPHLRDIDTSLAILRALGAPVSHGDDEELIADTRAVGHGDIPAHLGRQMRASVLFLGPLVARYGEATLPLPGGCAIGARPVDLHIEGLRAMGATVRIEGGQIHATAARLRGAPITLRVPTVTGTENLMMAATLAEGTTTLRNAAREPEIVDLAKRLSAMGARISGAGTDTISIEGVQTLRPADHTVCPDRIEAGTFLLAGALLGEPLTLRGVNPADLTAVLEALTALGCPLKTTGDTLTVSRSRLPASQITTAPFPGFPTDLQPQWTVLMALSDGTSEMTESIFESRFGHFRDLSRMGADIHIDARTARICGVRSLRGASVTGQDLRGTASLVLAGLAADGVTSLGGLMHLDRGYTRIEQKLCGVGARLSRQPPPLDALRPRAALARIGAG